MQRILFWDLDSAEGEVRQRASDVESEGRGSAGIQRNTRITPRTQDGGREARERELCLEKMQLKGAWTQDGVSRNDASRLGSYAFDAYECHTVCTSSL